METEITARSGYELKNANQSLQLTWKYLQEKRSNLYRWQNTWKEPSGVNQKFNEFLFYIFYGTTRDPINFRQTVPFKGTVARDCRPGFFSRIDPIWASDSHRNIFSNSVSKFLDIFGFVCVSALLDTALIQILFEDRYGYFIFFLFRCPLTQIIGKIFVIIFLSTYHHF